MPSRSNERRLAALAAAAILSVAAVACDEKKEEPERVEPPPPGGASSDIVATNIGTGLGLAAGLAPTSTQWERAIVLDEKRAVLFGRALDDAIALRTADGGRSWNAVSAGVDSYARWNASLEGALALAGGPRVTAAPALAAVKSARLWLAAPDGRLSEPTSFFGGEGALAGARIADGDALPAVVSPELAALVVDRGPASLVAFGTLPGGDAKAPVQLPRSERFLGTPHGRPPQLLSVAPGGAVRVRPWPQPGETVGQGSTIVGLNARGAGQAELDRPPGCEWGPWSFTRVSSGPSNAQLVGISPTRSFAFAAPPRSLDRIGCGPDALVVEIADEQGKLQLSRCTLEGRCAQPKSPPFELWPEPHERKLHLATTSKGVVAALEARAGARWGSYLAQSLDGGETFELPRVIGEGKTEAGRFEIAALLALGKRLLLLLSAEESGTGRRRWYVLASDDAGSNWGPP